MDADPTITTAQPAGSPGAETPRFEARPPATTAWQAPGLQPSGPEPEPVDAQGRQAETGGHVDAAADERPAEWGWRGRANRIVGLKVRASHAELVHRAARRRLLRPFTRPMTIVVANPKGGAAKTPTALLTAATLGFYRGGYTLAWDNNETRGTLGLRSEVATHHQTVVDLLGDIETFLSTSASVGALSGYLRPQTARFDVLASDDLPGRMDIIDGAAFGKLWTALSRYYRLMVIDTGNNVRASNWRAATSLADCLVVPTTVQPDVAESGLWMLDHLRHSGHAALATNAVAVISCADPKTDPVLLTDISDRYQEKVRDVVVIPHDPYIRAGNRIEYDSVGLTTRRSWLLACTSIIDSLSIRDQE